MEQIPAELQLDKVFQTPEFKGLHNTREIFKKEFLPAQKSAESAIHLQTFLKKTDKFLHRVEKDHQRNSEFKGFISGVIDAENNMEAAKKIMAETDRPAVATVNIDEYEEILKTATNKASEYIKTHHQYYFNILDQHHFSPKLGDDKTIEVSSEEIKKQVIDEVLNSAIQYVRESQSPVPLRIEPALKAFSHIGDQMIANSLAFEPLRENDPLSKYENPLKAIENIRAQSEAKMQIALAVPDVAAENFRNWVKTAKNDIDRGAKVLFTPYYKSILRKIEQVGDRENGIGGKLYYGPAGTGKTELAVEANRLDGFDTRVVSMHYWTDFTSLIGESAIPIAMDKNTGHMQRLDIDL